MHKPITTPDTQAAGTSAVAIFCGMMEQGQGPVFEAWGEGDMGGGVELFALCAAYGCITEATLQDLVRHQASPPFDFPGVYDYDVSEMLGDFLREMILRGEDPNHSDNIKLTKHELGRLMVEFFEQDGEFTAGHAEIVERHTGYKKG